MDMVLLGNTGMVVNKNGLGCLPIQRVNMEEAIRIFRRAYDAGITFYDTARAYTDSEEKLGNAFSPSMRQKIFIATKSMARDPDGLKKDLETSLRLLKTDYVDLFQFHFSPECYRPGDEFGIYECALKAKEEGKIRHLGITTHKLSVAREAIESGLYETLQYPFSYLSTPEEEALTRDTEEKGLGFIAMKALAGGLISNARAAYAYMRKFPNVLPIWGIQKMEELEQFLELGENPPDSEEEAVLSRIRADREMLGGEFCRGCGYCMPCPAGIQIPTLARMELFIKRARVEDYITPYWREEMKKVENCLHCGQCHRHCPYELDASKLLEKNAQFFWNYLKENNL